MRAPKQVDDASGVVVPRLIPHLGSLVHRKHGVDGYFVVSRSNL